MHLTITIFFGGSLSMGYVTYLQFPFSTFHCVAPKKMKLFSLWKALPKVPSQSMLILLRLCAKNLWTTSEQHHLSMTVILRPAGSHMSLIFHMLLVQGTIDPHHSRFSCRFLLVLHLQNVSSAQLERYFAQKESDSRLRNLNSLFLSSVTNTYVDNRAWTLNSDNDR